MNTEEKEKLLTENQNLVYHFIRTLTSHRERDMEDIIQELNFYLWQKMDLYNPSRGKFSTFAMKVFRSRMNHYLQDQKRFKRIANQNTISTDIPTKEGEVSFFDAFPSRISVENTVIFKLGLESLSEKEKDLLNCITTMEDTEEISKEMNMSKDNYYYHRKNLYKKIKELI